MTITAARYREKQMISGLRSAQRRILPKPFIDEFLHSLTHRSPTWTDRCGRAVVLRETPRHHDSHRPGAGLASTTEVARGQAFLDHLEVA